MILKEVTDQGTLQRTEVLSTIELERKATIDKYISEGWTLKTPQAASNGGLAIFEKTLGTTEGKRILNG
jgi:hypothetical protein